MQRGAPIANLDAQVEERVKPKVKRTSPEPVPQQVISTGSTLLDLAISGGVYPQGGIPGGILVEVFGPASAGKTVLLCEIAGGVQRHGGAVMFRDPEARLNRTFASLFGFTVDTALYDNPDTVVQLFDPIRKWEPETNGHINGVFADSLAALSTELEMTSKDGDKFGMRRAKEFSEQCRLTCRILAQRNILMVCSNQVRQNLDAGMFGERYKSPGGEAIGFYSSLRLRCRPPIKIQREREVGKGKLKRVVGVETTVEVYKNSIWEPYHSAPVTILFDYGIDDITANLAYVKDIEGNSSYVLGEQKLGASLERAVKVVEERGLENELKQKTIELWKEVEARFKVTRVGKRRQV